MRDLVFGICIVLAVSTICDFLIADEVSKIKQDIVELKKDFSYDPKDAK